MPSDVKFDFTQSVGSTASFRSTEATAAAETAKPKKNSSSNPSPRSSKRSVRTHLRLGSTFKLEATTTKQEDDGTASMSSQDENSIRMDFNNDGEIACQNGAGDEDDVISWSSYCQSEVTSDLPADDGLLLTFPHHHNQQKINSPSARTLHSDLSKNHFTVVTYRKGETRRQKSALVEERPFQFTTATTEFPLTFSALDENQTPDGSATPRRSGNTKDNQASSHLDQASHILSTLQQPQPHDDDQSIATNSQTAPSASTVKSILIPDDDTVTTTSVHEADLFSCFQWSSATPSTTSLSSSSSNSIQDSFQPLSPSMMTSIIAEEQLPEYSFGSNPFREQPEDAFCSHEQLHQQQQNLPKVVSEQDFTQLVHSAAFDPSLVVVTRSPCPRSHRTNKQQQPFSFQLDDELCSITMDDIILQSQDNSSPTPYEFSWNDSVDAPSIIVDSSLTSPTPPSIASSSSSTTQNSQLTPNHRADDSRSIGTSTVDTERTTYTNDDGSVRIIQFEPSTPSGVRMVKPLVKVLDNGSSTVMILPKTQQINTTLKTKKATLPSSSNATNNTGAAVVTPSASSSLSTKRRKSGKQQQQHNNVFDYSNIAPNTTAKSSTLSTTSSDIVSYSSDEEGSLIPILRRPGQKVILGDSSMKELSTQQQQQQQGSHLSKKTRRRGDPPARGSLLTHFSTRMFSAETNNPSVHSNGGKRIKAILNSNSNNNGSSSNHGLMTNLFKSQTTQSARKASGAVSATTSTRTRRHSDTSLSKRQQQQQFDFSLFQELDD